MKTIILNWKMYLTIQESRDLAAQISNWSDAQTQEKLSLMICPSLLALQDVHSQIYSANIGLGSQDIALSSKLGAYTGQVAAQHLKELSCEAVMIGHSERRKYNGVTDELVHTQLVSCLEHQLIPIVCIGESEEDRQKGATDQVLLQQLSVIFHEVDLADKQVVIAYEPRWAIGTGKPVDAGEASRIHQLIREKMKDLVTDISKIRVIYGGSISSETVIPFLAQKEIEGFLIGSAGTKFDQLNSLLQICLEH